MALVVKDRVRETSVTQGTGTFTLAGAVTGYQSFSAIGNGNTTYYTIYLQASNEWEVGIGTYTASGTTLSRDTILASSNGGSVVNFSAGTKDVFVTYPAGRSVYYDTATNVTVNQLSATTIDATNVEVTNVKAKDGTAALSIADSTGAVTVATAFAANGGVTIGDASGDAFTINSSAVSIPNGLNFDSNTFVIDASNNRVAVNLATPDAMLNVNGYTGTGTLRIGGSTTGESVLYFADSATGTGSYAGFLQYLHTSDGLVIGAGSAERVRITTGGQVNIGGNYTSTTNTLQVTGNASIGGYTTAAPTNGLIVAGNVGIGTDTVGQRLTVVATANDIAQFQNSVSYGTVLQINATATGGRNWKLHATANGDGVLGGGYFSIIDATANAYRLSIDLSGGVITRPSANGHAVFNEDSVDADFRVESDANTHRLFVDAGADTVLMGTTTNTNSSKLVVDGSISETVSSTQYLVASQYDIGTAANEIPLNQYLGNLAYQDASSIAGQVGLSAGTAALPSLVSATDLDTGMWFPAANTLAWSTGGTERARISSDGTFRVKGAGTAGSTDAFVVSGLAPANSFIVNNAGLVFVGQSAQKAGEIVRIGLFGTQSSILIDNSASTNGAFVGAFNDALLVGVNRNPSTGTFYDATKYASDIVCVGSASTSYIAFETANAANTAPTERTRITSIGGFETRPAANGHAVFNEDSVDADFRVESDTDTHCLFVDASTDRVGIGTNAPSTRLTVGGQTVRISYGTSNTNELYPTYSFYNTLNSVELASIVSGTGSAIDNGVLTFKTASGGTNTERARITSGGYFKASNTGTYDNATGAYHELRSDDVDDGVAVVESTNTSYTGVALFVAAARNTTNNTFYAISYYNRGASAYKFRVADSGAIATAGSISLGTVTPATSGVGVQFPATQSASSNANTLDDYEEGTWTPALSGSGTAGTFNLGTAVGNYTKIGNMVTLFCAITVTSVSGSPTGDLQITGLPFAVAAGTSGNGAAQTQYLGFTQNAIVSFSTRGSTSILYLCAVNGSEQIVYAQANAVGSSAVIDFCISYPA